MKIYIASPYTKGDVAVNVRTSILAAEQVRAKGHLPFAPLLSHFWHCMSPYEYEYWIAMDLEWALACDAILRLPGESSGADGEVALCKYWGKTIYYSIDDVPTILAVPVKMLDAAPIKQSDG